MVLHLSQQTKSPVHHRCQHQDQERYTDRNLSSVFPATPNPNHHSQRHGQRHTRSQQHCNPSTVVGRSPGRVNRPIPSIDGDLVHAIAIAILQGPKRAVKQRNRLPKHKQLNGADCPCGWYERSASLARACTSSKSWLAASITASVSSSPHKSGEVGSRPESAAARCPRPTDLWRPDRTAARSAAPPCTPPPPSEW